MMECCLGKIDQFLSDDIVKGRLEPKTSSDRLSDLALLDPDFVHFPGIHRPTLLRSTLTGVFGASCSPSFDHRQALADEVIE